MIDVHLHTRFSFDSYELPENYIEAAKRLAVPVIGFSEHYDYDAFLNGADVALCEIDKYFAYIDNLGKKYPDIKILRGIEFGYSAEAVGRYGELIKKYPFDYVINSVHTVGGKCDFYYDKAFEGRTLKECYGEYFNAVFESLKAGFNYQIVGHIGYVSRYRTGVGSKIEYKDYAEIIDRILKEIISRGKCLEINTSIGKSTGDYLPDRDIIERYISLGGSKLSFGSDAHGADRYSDSANKLRDYLRGLGVNKLCYYEQSKCVFYDI